MRATTEVLTREVAPEEGLRQFLADLLSSKKVDGVIALSRAERGELAYSLMTSEKAMEYSRPLHPLMPVNLGQILTRLTFKGRAPRPIAVVARPCELRAFVETMKRRQGSADNMLFISCTCPGVFPLEAGVGGRLEARLAEYWRTVGENEVHVGLRPACRSCVEFVPYTADLVVRLVEQPQRLMITAESELGRKALSDTADELVSLELSAAPIMTLMEKRKEGRKNLFEEKASVQGLDSLVDVFGKCIGCHACSKACPICYCTSCTFESRLFEKEADDYYKELDEKKGVRLPPGMARFHLGRMVHMAVSCVGCGSCEDVCPVGIPVSMVFKKVGESLQKTFEYLPGRNPQESVPLSAFELEEFKGLGE